MITIENTFHRDKFEELYPDGVVPRKDVISLMSVFIDSIEKSVISLEDRLASNSPLHATAVKLCQPIRVKELTEIRNDLNEHSQDITIDQTELIINYMTDHLSKFVDFLYGPPQFEVDWFQEFLKKYRNDIPF